MTTINGEVPKKDDDEGWSKVIRRSRFTERSRPSIGLFTNLLPKMKRAKTWRGLLKEAKR